MKKAIVVVMLSVLVVFSSSGVADTLRSMTKDQIRQAFVDKTVTSLPINRLNGKAITSTTFSMFIDSSGNVLAKMAIKPENQPQTDTGTFSIKRDGTFYLTWQHWDNAKKVCFHLYDTQNAYLAIDCNHFFHVAFAKSPIQSGNQLK